MPDINQERLGSTLDEWLEDEGILAEITALAHQGILAWHIKHV